MPRKRKSKPTADARRLIGELNRYVSDLARTRGISNLDAVAWVRDNSHEAASVIGASPDFIVIWATQDLAQAKRMGRVPLSEARRGDPLKPRRGTFDVATRGGERETVSGYVLGDYGMRKEKWFWKFTHLPTGVKLLTYPTIERLPDAIEYLKDLAANGPSRETERKMIQKYGDQWGMGMKERLRP